MKDYKNEVFLGYTIIDGYHNGNRKLIGLEELANFIVEDKNNKIVTDLMDELVLNTFGIYINQCTDKDMLPLLLEILIPLQKSSEEEFNE